MEQGMECYKFNVTLDTPPCHGVAANMVHRLARSKNNAKM